MAPPSHLVWLNLTAVHISHELVEDLVGFRTRKRRSGLLMMADPQGASI